MIASEARLAANRANALKSRGPTSAEGKERSRGNAVKHGLTGAGVAIGAEEAAAVEARLAGFRESYRPVTEAGKNLLRRVALLSVRLERCAEQQAAATARRVRAAADDFDEARAEEVEALFGSLADDPARAVRRLSRMPEGVDRMVAAYRDLRHDLTHRGGSRWDAKHDDLLIRLSGRKPWAMGASRVEALLSALGRHWFHDLGPEDGAGLDNKGRAEWARQALAELIDRSIAALEARRATLDLEGIAADRAEAGARALFDASKEAALARKYEAAAAREIHRTLKEMRAVEAEAAAAPPEPAPPLGSFSPGDAKPTPAPTPTPAAEPPAPRSGAPEGSTFAPTTLGRPDPARS